MVQPTTAFPRLDALFALLAAALSVSFAIFVIGPAALQLQYPIAYDGDALSHGLLIKSIVDTGWYLELSRVGAPFSASFLSYPIDEGFHLVLLKVLAFVSGSYAATFNLFYIGSFATVAIASYVVLRMFGVAIPLSVAGAVIYAIIPYHFLRLSHLFLASYVTVPIAVGLAYYAWLRGIGNQLPWEGWRRVLLFVGALIVGSAGVYYAAFACLLLGVSAVSATFARKSIRGPLPGLGWIGFVGLVVLLNVSPHLIHSVSKGAVASATSTRSPSESELYSLRPSLLVLPTPAHRSRTLAAIGNRYSQTMVLVNENRSAALGIMGSVGLLALLIVAWRRLAGNDPTRSEIDEWLSTQTIVVIAVGTFGGLGALFAFLVSPALRGYNRISVVISFLATAMLVLCAQRFMQARFRGGVGVIATSTLAIAMILFATWDQTSEASRANHVQIDSVWQSDAKFVRSVEATVEPEGNILIWPYVRFPEQAPLHEEGYNGLLRLPLHAQRSRWSYGAMVGSEADRWLSALANMPLALIPTLAGKSGISGIVVARRALKDGGREADSIFAAVLGPPKLSDDGSFAFYGVKKTGSRPLSTADFGVVLAEAMTTEQYEAILRGGISFSTDEKNRALVVSELKGFSVMEPWGRWTDANLADRGIIKLIRPLPASGRLLLKVRCYAASCNGKVRVRMGAVEHLIDLRGVAEQEITLPLSSGGGAEIDLFPANPSSPRSVSGAGDDRILGIGIMSLRWEPEAKTMPQPATIPKRSAQPIKA